MTDFDFEAAAKLPRNIRFGTSTWTYPGWKGSIYHREYKSEKEFNHKTLEEYAAFPLFRTVGIDSFFYGPPKVKTLQDYAAQVPPEFLWVSKVWEHLSVLKFPTHPRYGKYAGQENPSFLNAEVFIESVLKPYREAGVEKHTGPFVFQFGTIAKNVLSPAEFFTRLENFLGKLPADFQYAMEIRNPEYLVADYFQTLNKFGATHCFNHWNYMPRLRDQMKAAADAGGLTAPFYAARILTPKGVSYEAAVKLFSPYDSIKQPNPEMRDDVKRLVRRAIETEKSAFVIVNNRAEGYAPGTIDAVGRDIAKDLQ